jgi:hypothetical protein
METAYFNTFIIEMTQEQAESASHPGPCDNDVAYLLTLPEIQSQLAEISSEDLVSELFEYGAWDSEELSERDDNEARIIWIAAGSISYEIYNAED